MSKRILITGAAGFIGSHLAEKLDGLGVIPVGIDNFDDYYDRRYKELNLKHVSDNTQNFKFFEDDISNTETLTKILKDESIDLVVHLAAKAGVRPSFKDPISYMGTNIEGTYYLIEAMKQANLKKLVFASSSSVYGKSKLTPFSELDPLKEMISYYAFTKKSGEDLCRFIHNIYEFDIAILRFFTVYGPRQRPDLAIHKFLKKAINEEEITLFGDGTMARDYTYVSDTVQGIYKACLHVLNNKNIYDTFNLGNSYPVNLKELVEAIEKVTGKTIKKSYQEVPEGDVPITYANIEKSKKVLGYNPEVKLEDGLQRFYNWMIENQIETF